MKKLYFFLLLMIAASVLLSQTIYDIQYTENPGSENTYPSTYEGQVVTVEGIVTATGFDGYADNIYIQMPDGGMWSGIYVYISGDTLLSQGDLVEVTGEVQEYYGLTELSWVQEINVISSGNPLPEPLMVTTEDLSGNEAYEGVLVEVNDVYVSSEPNDYGEWYVVDESAVPCQIDDEFFYLDSVDPPIEITMGDYWATIRGIVTYSYDEYQLDPRYPEDLMAESAGEENYVTSANRLKGNYPNPFNPVTTIEYQLEEADYVQINIYNAKGAKVNTLVNETKAPGTHQANWNGKDYRGNSVSSGIYFYQLNSAENTLKKMILLK